MARRKLSEPVAEDEEWMTTYADAITLLMAFFVMLVNFSKKNRYSAIRRYDGGYQK
jgi:chemotaxis protein MotB